ncbi:MAG: helix-turn-helix domain-containing protein [Bacillota bacterium]
MALATAAARAAPSGPVLYIFQLPAMIGLRTALPPKPIVLGHMPYYNTPRRKPRNSFQGYADTDCMFGTFGCVRWVYNTALANRETSGNGQGQHI